MPQNLPDEKSKLVQVMLSAIKQQAIICANVHPDLCRHMTSLCHTELILQLNSLYIPHSRSSDHMLFFKH